MPRKESRTARGSWAVSSLDELKAASGPPARIRQARKEMEAETARSSSTSAHEEAEEAKASHCRPGNRCTGSREGRS